MSTSTGSASQFVLPRLLTEPAGMVLVIAVLLLLLANRAARQEWLS